MSQLAATAQSLREVREAYQNFLMHWALEELTSNPESMAQMAGDVFRQKNEEAEENRERAQILLHRRTILDD